MHAGRSLRARRTHANWRTVQLPGTSSCVAVCRRADAATQASPGCGGMLRNAHLDVVGNVVRDGHKVLVQLAARRKPGRTCEKGGVGMGRCKGRRQRGPSGAPASWPHELVTRARAAPHRGSTSTHPRSRCTSSRCEHMLLCAAPLRRLCPGAPPMSRSQQLERFGPDTHNPALPPSSALRCAARGPPLCNVGYVADQVGAQR